jgi:hypothetical protein
MLQSCCWYWQPFDIPKEMPHKRVLVATSAKTSETFKGTVSPN